MEYEHLILIGFTVFAVIGFLLSALALLLLARKGS